MDDRDDMQLLAEYAASGSEAAFTELVRRHSGLVYSCALRRTANPHSAQEVAQTVFLLLAQKARELPPGTLLAGWLFRATTFVAKDSLKLSARRSRLHSQFNDSSMQTLNSDPSGENSEALHRALEHHLLEWLDRLNLKEREILLLRHFEGQPLASIARTLGITEDGARKRVERAMEKLRCLLARRGIHSSERLLSEALNRCALVAGAPDLAHQLATAVLQARAAGTVAHVSGMSSGTTMVGLLQSAAGISVILSGVGAVTITAVSLWKEPTTSFVEKPLSLPDGTVLEFQKPAFTQQQVISVSTSSWQRLLGRSPSQQALPNLRVQISAQKPKLMFPAVRLVPKGVEPWNLWLAVVDDNGREYFDSEQSGMMNDDTPLRLETHVVTAFPRREKTLRFHLSALPQAGGSKVLLRSLELPNPAWAQYSQWRPEPLPASRTNGHWVMDLIRLVGAREVPSPRVDAHLGKHRDAAALVQFREAGVASHDWLITDIIVSDATGNHFSTGLPPSFEEGNRTWVPLRGALWPGEKAWELQFHVARSSGFKESEKLQSEATPIPQAGEWIQLDEDFESDVGTLSLISIRDRSAEERESWRWPQVQGQTVLHLEWKPDVPHGWMDLVEVKDDQDRTVAFHVVDRMGASQSVGMNPLPGARRLRLTFTMQKPLEVTFRVGAEEEAAVQSTR